MVMHMLLMMMHISDFDDDADENGDDQGDADAEVGEAMEESEANSTGDHGVRGDGAKKKVSQFVELFHIKPLARRRICRRHDNGAFTSSTLHVLDQAWWWFRRRPFGAAGGLDHGGGKAS